MKIIEALRQRLLKHGMSDTQADEVMKLAREPLLEQTKFIAINLDDDEKDCWSVIINILYITVKNEAYKYLIKNKPKAWFMGMFRPS